ncbi:5,6-dimethylbenzimidazole synthase [Psychrobium sp. 1_MG-2023]|uniref:5,6-dimethylbenzimidazole synthase n=1 Tax=Psychrobium sp. 1_MG-2023 TaxID=3062624 RepID=UPI002735E451|nr:5,6-dimethylbenzimidazole synthase [Psychrobium sp. 1_MG-2023]MDP2560437.1 5,6-dimethylbenzimidazole synthase [Psychrobium sp. 1_MG-2023]
MNRLFNAVERDVFKDILRLRRDVRGNKFTQQPVPDDVIEQLIDAAMLAPSVGYSQPWQLVVIKSQAVKQKVYQSFCQKSKQEKELFPSDKQEQYQKFKLEGIIEAPINIAVFYQRPDAPILGQTAMKETGKYSVVCAIQNMWLMARALNVGMGWVSILDPQVVKNAVNAPENSELIGYLCIGYVDEFLEQPELKTAGWQQQKSRQQTVFNDSF